MRKKFIKAAAMLLTTAMILTACSEAEPDYDFTVSYDGIKTENVSSPASVHDPSIFKDGDTYYIFGSHMSSATSPDLLNWTPLAGGYRPKNTVYGQIYDVYDEAFAYAGAPTSLIPTDDAGRGGEHVWAPDVIYNEKMGKYVMYYCTTSTWCASNLCYGTADAPEGPYVWQGALIYSGFDKDTIKGTDVLDYVDEDYALETYIKGNKGYRYEDWPNAIDPAVFYDGDGKLWMVYGSWSGGIFLLELDEATGEVIHPDSDHDNNVDAYFGKRLVGGGHESMEAPYILWDEESGYYYLFVSYGALDREGGYQIRLFRSEKPDGEYVDMNGQNLGASLNNAYYGLKISGNYMLPSLPVAYMATGHNSAFVDDDGKKYIVFHTRFNQGNEVHSPRAHQYITNSEGWPCMLPYQTQGETVSETGYSKDEIAGRYYMINQGTAIDAKIAQPEILYLTSGGKAKTENEEGTWEVEKDTYYITITLGEKTYNGVLCAMDDEAGTPVMTFSAVGYNESVWGVKYVEAAE